MIDRRLEQVDAVQLALGHEGAPSARTHVNDGFALGFVKAGESAGGTHGKRLVPLGLIQIKPRRFQRVITAPPLDAGPGVVSVGDHRHPLSARFAAQVIERDGGVLRQIVEQAGHVRIEQRQIVLHPRTSSALRNCGVERIIAGRTEGLEISGPEPADGVLIQQGLIDRQKGDLLQLSCGALGLRVKAADRFQRVAEQVQTDRLV